MEGRTLRPLGVGETLDTAFNLCFRNFGLMLKIAAAVVLPIAALSAVLLLVGLQETDQFNPDARLYEIANGEFRVVDQSTYIITSIIAAVLSAVAYLVATGALFKAVSDRYIGRPASASDSIGTGLRRAHSMLWISVLMLVTFFVVILPAAAAPILILLFSVPLIAFLLTRWCTAIPALMVEGKKGSKALGRSFELTGGRGWQIFAALLVAVVFIALIEFLTSLAAGGLGELVDGDVTIFIIVLSVLGGLGTLLTAPFQAAVVTVIYYDMRVRKEAYDVALMTEQLDTPGGPGLGPPPAVPPAPSNPASPEAPGSTPPPPPSTPSGW
jgi:hypothetical protein